MAEGDLSRVTTTERNWINALRPRKSQIHQARKALKARHFSVPDLPEESVLGKGEKAKAKKNRKLSLVEEDQNAPQSQQQKQQKLKQRPPPIIIAQNPNRMPIQDGEAGGLRKAARKKRLSRDHPCELSLLPQLGDSDSSSLATPRTPLISPIPLPAGVVCIDPMPEEDSTLCYAADFIAYVTRREALNPGPRLVDVSQNVKHRHCSLLLTWILELVAHFRYSQETLYHTTELLYASLAMRPVNPGELQLLGVACFFVAAKLEEYSPPSVATLLDLTENSYAYAELLDMEVRLITLHNGVFYRAAPAIFISRYVSASQREDDQLFVHTVSLCYDCLIPYVDLYLSYSTSKKAAAAVMAALVILSEDGEVEWSPSLAFYTTYRMEMVWDLALTMVEKLLVAVSKKTHEGIIRKFASSRHDRILRGPHFVAERLRVICDRMAAQRQKLTNAMTD